MSGDKSTGQIVGGIVGAVIGYYAGGVTGVYYGYAIGSGIGGYIDPPPGPSVEGPRLNDLKAQTSGYGQPIPRVYGTMQTHGNVFWLENNKLKEVVTKEEQGGKGGPGAATVKTYTYYATFALSVCEGPIEAVSRIWVNGQIIYNAKSSDLDTVIRSNQNARGWTVYHGSDDQLPDPRMQADIGAANCPGYVGLCYILFEDFELTDYGNTLQGAQIKVEVIKNASVASSGFIDDIIIERQPLPDVTVAQSRAPLRNYIFQSGKDATVHFQYQDTLANTHDEKVQYLDNGNELRVYDGITKGFVPGTIDRDVTCHRPAYGGWGSGFYPVLQIDGENYWPTEVNSGYFHYRNYELFWVYLDTGTTWRVEKLQPGHSLLTSNVATSAGYTATDGMAMGVDGNGDVYIAHDAGVTKLDGSDLTEIDSESYTWPHTIERPFGYCDMGRFYVIERSTSEQGDVFEFNELELETYYEDVVDSATNADTNIYIVDSRVIAQVTDYGASDAGVQIKYFRLIGATTDDGTPLSEIVEAEFTSSELIQSADVDVTALTDNVRGLRVPGVMSPRAAISPLQGAYPFDIIPSGYQLKCVPRGQSSVKTISADDLDARSWGDGSGVELEMSREMDSQLPRKVIIRHIDPGRAGDLNEQYSAEKNNSGAVNIREFEMPLSLSADEAAQVADIIWQASWLERDRFAFKLPPTHLDLEPADVITLETDYATLELRIEQISYDANGVLDIQARANAAGAWASDASGGEGNLDDDTLSLVTTPYYQLMDIPMIRDADDFPGFAAAMAGVNTNWPGGALYRSLDNQQTWTPVQAFAGSVPIGQGREPLSANDCFVIDHDSELQVDLIAGDLYSITEAQMLTGLHWCAYGAAGRWELMRYATATLQSDGSYILTDLIRGCKGTEWTTGLHVYGDRFVFLDDSDTAAIGSSLELIGVIQKWRGASQGQAIEDIASTDFTYRGVNLTPLSPVGLGGSKDSNGDWTITWKRRSRYNSSFWSTGTQPPVGEDSESYEIEILSGATVLRTLTSSTNSVDYTEEQQEADFGSGQSELTIKVYQISAAVGRGYPAEGTILSGSDDPYYSQVAALLHFNGANGSTSFLDSKSNTWSAGGDAQISDSQSKWGESLYLDGSGDYITTNDASNFDFGTDDFTVECWVYLTGSGDRTLYSAISGSTGLTFRITPAGYLQYLYGGGLNTNTGSTTVTSSTWVHVALSRESGTARLFVDGVLDTSFSASESLTSLGSTVVIGKHRNLSQDYFSGYIDEYRVTKGVARYTASFTPPASPFPD